MQWDVWRNFTTVVSRFGVLCQLLIGIRGDLPIANGGTCKSEPRHLCFQANKYAFQRNAMDNEVLHAYEEGKLPPAQLNGPAAVHTKSKMAGMNQCRQTILKKPQRLSHGQIDPRSASGVEHRVKRLCGSNSRRSAACLEVVPAVQGSMGGSVPCRRCCSALMPRSVSAGGGNS